MKSEYQVAPEQRRTQRHEHTNPAKGRGCGFESRQAHCDDLGL